MTIDLETLVLRDALKWLFQNQASQAAYVCLNARNLEVKVRSSSIQSQTLFEEEHNYLVAAEIQQGKKKMWKSEVDRWNWIALKNRWIF